MKVLYIVRGIPGSGKTTYAEGLGLKHHYETDQFWGEDYDFDPSRLREAHQWCQDVTETALADGNDVVVSNTFIRQWEIEPYRRMAERHQADVVEHICRGSYQSVHNVPDHIVAKMERQFEEHVGR
jgi:predicted kinase